MALRATPVILQVTAYADAIIFNVSWSYQKAVPFEELKT